MNSQVYPLPQRAADGEFHVAPRGELDLKVADGAPTQPMGRMLVEWGRLAEDDVDVILEYQARSKLPFGEAGVALGMFNEEDVQQVLAAQFGHASVSRDNAGVSPELVALTEPSSDVVEHLRSVRSQLMLRWFEHEQGHAALAIVSPGQGEGRSWIAANLAVLFAQLGKRTILIDADLRNPRQHQIFGVHGGVGLSAVLAGRAGWEAVREIEMVRGLWLLPAGALPPNPQELLARPGLQRLVTVLSTSYDVILMDTPPAERCADAGTIAARAGGALVVACRDRSSVPRVSGLCEDLRQFGVATVGAVMNGAPSRAGRH